MTRPLRLAPPAGPDPAADALRAFALALAPYMAELLGAPRDGELVDVVAAVPAPRRSVLAACRRGDVQGASRVGRRWLASRGAIDAWLRTLGPRTVAAPDEGDELEETRRRLVQSGRRRRLG